MHAAGDPVDGTCAALLPGSVSAVAGDPADGNRAALSPGPVISLITTWSKQLDQCFIAFVFNCLF